MANREKMSAVIDLRGLDLVTPVDLLSDGRTPYSKNFRLYAQQADDRRVAVSSRKGSGYYINNINQTVMEQNVSTTGASTADVGVIEGVHAFRFTASNNDRLSRIDINLKDVNQASAPLMVEIYTDADDRPTALLTQSSILGGDIGSVSSWSIARFVNAPQLVQNQKYWVVLRMQDDGKNTYSLSTTTTGTPAYTTNSSLSQLQQQPYSLNYKLYTSTNQTDKGSYRFARDNGNNITLAAYGNTMYYIDEVSSTLMPLLSGLSSVATDYKFTNGDNRVFWVNGYDKLTSWDGTMETQALNIVSNPSFSINTTAWSAVSGSTLSRVTSDFKTAPASLQVTASSGASGASAAISMLANHRYKISFWAKGVAGSSNIYMTVNGQATAIAGSTKSMPNSWSKYEMYYEPGLDITSIEFRSPSDNFFIDDVSIADTGIEYIVDDQLPILSDIIMHKDRLWGVVASDPNKLVFSENPGNPSNLPVGQQWYRQWLSVSFLYVPRPHNGSPITGMVSFQDALVVFTQDEKYIISGYDRGSISMRKSTGSKGALSSRSIAVDENSIYFVSDDGFYQFNGSSDEKLSARISPLFDACGHKTKISPIVWKGQVRFYMASQGSAHNNICAIYDKELKEWMLDTDTWVNRAIYYDDADDQHQLVEFSSLTTTAYFAEQGYHSLGAPIDFEYRLKYDSMKSPMQKKRIRKFYPILQGVDSTFTLQLAMDKDFEDSPKVREQLLTTNGAKWGEFKWGDGTIYGGDKSFKPKRQSYSGYAYYWQLRVIRKGVNNRVAFVGAQYSYKTKRL